MRAAVVALVLSLIACSGQSSVAEPVASTTYALDAMPGGVWQLRDRGGVSAEDHVRFVYHAAMQKVLLVSARPNRGVYAWDGKDWSFVAEPAGTLYMQGAAYDEMREHVVLFGGLFADHVGADNSDATTLFVDGAWQPLTVRGPAAGGGAVLAYDRKRDRIVLTGGAEHTNGGARAETWLFDGETWTEATTEQSPASQYAGAAYDAEREVVVLAMAVDGSASETWEWDGSAWARIAAATPLPYAYQYWLAYDEKKKRVVSVVEGARWEWDGATWKRAGSTDGKEADRGTPPLAYDAARSRLVAYRSQQNLTWEHDGTAWKSFRAGRPRARQGAASVYDAARQRVVYFGATTDVSDATWEWDGAAWKRGIKAAMATPSGLVMAYDAARERSVLVVDGNTWEYDGTSWTNAGTAPGNVSLMAYDAELAATVALIGGDTLATWTWDGVAWLDTGTGAPTSVRDGAMAYDALRKRLVCFGGYTDGSGDSEIDETWEWDGKAWTQKSPTVSPAPRGGHGLAFDARRGRIVLYGGYYHNELWEYDGTTWSQRMTQAGPPSSFSNGLVYDVARDRMVFYASDGTLWEYFPVGEACDSDDACATGACVDGVCCDRACTSSCEACSGETGAVRDGLCTLLPDAGADCVSSAVDGGAGAGSKGKKGGGCSLSSSQRSSPAGLWLLASVVALIIARRRCRAPLQGPPRATRTSI
jgi:hypothetical protein